MVVASLPVTVIRATGTAIAWEPPRIVWILAVRILAVRILAIWILAVRIMIERILAEGIWAEGISLACIAKGSAAAGLSGRWWEAAVFRGFVVNVCAADGAGDLLLIHHPSEISINVGKWGA